MYDYEKPEGAWDIFDAAVAVVIIVIIGFVLVKTVEHYMYSGSNLKTTQGEKCVS